MTIRVGINGFGRMGRLALRAGWESPDFAFTHINEIKGGAATAAHLLEFDSVHGRWQKEIEATESGVVVDGRVLTFSEHAIPADVPWADLGVDVVIEASGKFRTLEGLQAYLDGGVRKVVVAAP